MKHTYKFHVFFVFLIIVTTQTMAQVNWTKYPDNPVITKGPDDFDVIAIGQPTTFFENDTIKMWYAGVGPDMKARICYAYSTDGISWTKHFQPVIDTGSQGEWDCGWLDTPCIVKDNTGYRMYYYGDTVQQFAAISSSMGMATSSDGIHWTKYPGNPVFLKGNPGEWDGSWIESPSVIFDSVSNEYLMWYNGVDTSTWKVQIGLATSSDGTTWNKHPDNPILRTGNWGEYDDIWLGTPSVLKTGNIYEMWYSATSTNSYNGTTEQFDTISMCYATSQDGINWIKYAGNPLFNNYTAPYDSLIDTGGPWAPSVIFNHLTNTYMMWYEAHGGNYDFSFSLATASNADLNIHHHAQIIPDIHIYPVPFSDELKITNIPATCRVQLFNVTGMLVYDECFSGLSFDHIISTSLLPSGLYVLQVSGTTFSISFKALKF